MIEPGDGRNEPDRERGGKGADGGRDAAFRGHFGTYLLFGVFFFVLNLLTDPGNWWFYWPMFGWGIGVVAHAFATYGADAPARIVALLHDWTGRLVPLSTPPHPPIPPLHHRPAPGSQAPPTEGADRTRPDTAGLDRILRDGEAKVDAMRRAAARPSTSVPRPIGSWRCWPRTRTSARWLTISCTAT